MTSWRIIATEAQKEVNNMTENKTYKPIPESRNYTRDELIDAGKLAQIIVSVPSEKRSTFGLMVEAMIMGAEMAERHLTATSNTT